MKILIVDDEAEILALYKVILETQDYDITALTNPAEAITLIEDNKYDLVITDKKMPHVSGLEIISHVEAKSEDTVLFLITGDNTESIDFTNSKSKVFKKPFPLEILRDEVAKLV